MADTKFNPRILHLGDVVRTEDRSELYVVSSISTDEVVVKHGSYVKFRNYQNIYPIKLQDTNTMKAIGIEVHKIWQHANQFVRKYILRQGFFTLKMEEDMMGYFGVSVEDKRYQNQNFMSRLYYLHEVQQFFFNNTNEELRIIIPNKLEFEAETVHFWDKDGNEVIV